MIFKNDIIEEIKFSHIKNVIRVPNVYEFIDLISGDAIVIDDDDNKKVAGNIRAYHIDIEDMEYSTADYLDEHSSALEEFVPFFKNNQIDEIIYKTLNIKIGEMEVSFNSDAALIIDLVYVEKDFRGENIGQLLINTLCNDYRRNARFAFLKAFPLQYEGSDNTKDLPEEKRKVNEEDKVFFKNRDEKESQNKLIELYEKCGFKLIKGTKSFMVCDLIKKFIV